MTNDNLKVLLEVIDNYKESISDGLYLTICQDLKHRFRDNDSDTILENGWSPVLVVDQEIDPEFSDLYKFMVICVMEQRGPNSACNISTKYSQNGTPMDRVFLLHYLNSVSDTYYCLNCMRYDIDSLKTCQIRDCQTFQTGNHYVTLTFTTYHKIHKTFYNLSFSTMFKQDYKNYTIGNQQIKITYSSDLVVKKSERDLYPSPNHVIGLGDGTAYYRTTIFSTTVSSQDPIIRQLPSQYLLE